MNSIKTFARRTSAAAIAAAALFVSFAILSVFATLGLAVLGISAAVLCIPVALGLHQRTAQQDAAATA